MEPNDRSSGEATPTKDAPTIPTSMRAVRLLAWGASPELVETAVPTPGPGEVLVRVAGNGLCHSDLTMTQIPAEIGEALGWHMPFTLGHEASGTIVALGNDVDVDWGLGDAIVAISTNSCRDCRFCRGGRESLCSAGAAGRGYGRDGGLAEYVVVPERDLIRWDGPEELLADAGTLSDAGATSYHAVARVLEAIETAGADGVQPSVVVIGVGGLGAYAVQILRAVTDATVIAVEPDAARRTRAAELGAHHVIDGVDSSTVRSVRDLVGTDGADAVIDLVGNDATIKAGLKVLVKGGAFALVGAGGGALTTPWNAALPHEANVFTFQGSRPAHARATVALASSGAIRLETERFTLDEALIAYDRLHDGSLIRRAVVVP